MGEKIREGKKFTQTDLAKSIKASQTNISKYLTGKRKPSVSLVANVCRVHGISPEFIILGTGEIKKSSGNNLEQRVKKLELLFEHAEVKNTNRAKSR